MIWLEILKAADSGKGPIGVQSHIPRLRMRRVLKYKTNGIRLSKAEDSQSTLPKVPCAVILVRSYRRLFLKLQGIDLYRIVLLTKLYNHCNICGDHRHQCNVEYLKSICIVHVSFNQQHSNFTSIHPISLHRASPYATRLS